MKKLILIICLTFLSTLGLCDDYGSRGLDAYDGTGVDDITVDTITVNTTISVPNDSLSGDDIDGGTISSFASTGIDDNASSTAMTISSSGEVIIGTTTDYGAYPLQIFSQSLQGIYVTDGTYDIEMYPSAGSIGGVIKTSGHLALSCSGVIYLDGVGTGAEAALNIDTSNDQFIIAADNESLDNQIIFTDYAFRGRDFDHPACDNTTLFIQGQVDPNVDNTQWVSVSYSSANDRAEIDTGGGEIVFKKAITRPLFIMNTSTHSTSGTDYISNTYSDTGTSTVTLSTADLNRGSSTQAYEINIKDADFNASTNNIFVVTEGAATIDEAASATINTDGASLTVYSDGSNWLIK